MKKILVLVLVISPILCSAQFLRRLKDAAQSTLEGRAEAKTTETVNQTVDKVEASGKKKPSSDTKEEKKAKPSHSSSTSNDSLKAYSKFDFIPGSEVVYFNNFEGDSQGELPTDWNSNGSGEVVKLRDMTWVKLLQNATFITDNKKAFTDNFTVEFDLLMDLIDADARFPQITFGMLSSGDLPTNDNEVLQNINQNAALGIDLGVEMEENSFALLQSYKKGSRYFNSGQKAFPWFNNLIGKTIHVSMQVQKERFRVWFNETKLYDVPKALPTAAAINQLYFSISDGGFSNEQVGIYVTNIKVAKGVPDTRHKLIDEGKFSTTGILFNVNSAVIKPESYGVLKEIAGVLKDNPTVKVKIIGHTDSDGSDASNLTLSKKRSEAVKNALSADFGIDASRLSTEGKGETSPVSDNKTKEGKAQNRRVEFIKL